MGKLLEQLLGQHADDGSTTSHSLSQTEEKILRLLVRNGEMYGLELVGQSDGEIKRGTVYVTLQRMGKKGFVESRQEEPTPSTAGLPRRLYRITGVGAEILRRLDLFRALRDRGFVAT